MKGTMLVLLANGGAVRSEHDCTPEPETLKAALGGGWLEKVPGFSSVEVDGKTHKCVALCDEDGKSKNLPLNRTATLAWHVALREEGHPGLIVVGGHNEGAIADVLCGDIVILFGDRKFMDSL